MKRPPTLVLESVTGSNIFEFLGDFRRRPVQFLRHTLLFKRLHRVELLTQVAINHILRVKTKQMLRNQPVMQLLSRAAAVTEQPGTRVDSFVWMLCDSRILQHVWRIIEAKDNLPSLLIQSRISTILVPLQPQARKWLVPDL